MTYEDEQPILLGKRWRCTFPYYFNKLSTVSD